MTRRAAPDGKGRRDVATEVRGAEASEYPMVREIIARAMGPDEVHLWDYLVAHDASLRPEGVRVALADGRPVACTVALPRQVRARRDWVSGAIVTLVACDPAFQGRGYGGRTVRDALAYLQQRQMALGILYGHATYYPRFGFAPVLPDYHTTVDCARCPDQQEALRPVVDADVPALAALYAEQLASYPCAVARDAAPWQWQVRDAERHMVLTLPAREGYAFVTPEREQDVLLVREAAAADRAAAWRLIGGLAWEARRRSLARVRLCMPPDHALVRLALMLEATYAYRPAAHGMAAITRWEALLPAGYEASGEGLLWQSRLALRASSSALTQLALGYRGIEDLLLVPECELLGSAEDLESLRRDFAPCNPKWSLAPYWY